jgi:hypothetical protein
MPFMFNDGGRAESGRRGEAGDCVTRALAIATGVDYDEVYRDLARGMAKRGKPRSARNGVHRSVYRPWLEAHGFEWRPTMAIGSGCTTHVHPDELPTIGRFVLRLTHHLSALVDGVVLDTFDPSRDGTRCVYGLWIGPPDWD